MSFRAANSSKQIVVADEALVLRDLVVERARPRVVVLGQPVEPRRLLLARVVRHRLDQRPRHALAARRLVGEQVLQIAVVTGRPAGAVIEIVDDAEQLAVHSGSQQPHRLIRIQEPLPRGVVGLLRHRDVVEIEIALPQRLPRRALVGTGGRIRAADNGVAKGVDDVHVTGPFIIAGKHLWPALEQLVHHNVTELLKNNLMDDDQTLLLMSYLQKPELFELHKITGPDWFVAFRDYSDED